MIYDTFTIGKYFYVDIFRIIYNVSIDSLEA
jgi:hypothetical protein